jgi:hypothetical protein
MPLTSEQFAKVLDGRLSSIDGYHLSEAQASPIRTERYKIGGFHDEDAPWQRAAAIGRLFQQNNPPRKQPWKLSTRSQKVQDSIESALRYTNEMMEFTDLRPIKARLEEALEDIQSLRSYISGEEK